MANTKIKLKTFFVAKDGEAVYSQQKQDLELTVAQLLITKFRLKLKKAGKTTRPARYDLHKIPYEYAEEVTNRFKGLDLVNMCLKNYGWRSVILYRRQRTKPSQRKRKARRQSGYLRRLYK